MIQLSQVMVMKLDQILERAVSTSVSSPTLSPLLQPHPRSPLPSPSIQPPNATLLPPIPGGLGSHITSSEYHPNAHMHQVDSLELPPSTVELNDWIIPHDIDPQLILPEIFPEATPGDEFNHVKLATNKEHEEFTEQLTAKGSFLELSGPSSRCNMLADLN